MKATWSNEDTESASSYSSSSSSQKSVDELCFMAYGDEHEEVYSNYESFSIQEWEDAYEFLLKKCKNFKKGNKTLKKKISECVHDTSL